MRRRQDDGDASVIMTITYRRQTNQFLGGKTIEVVGHIVRE